MQSDHLGSTLFAANEQGEVLRYAERGAWGDLKVPIREDLNWAGVESSLMFTNYRYDPVIEKYFAQARFYDAGQGRMLARDPVKTGLNGYPYCKNNPVNYIDPDGKVATLAIAIGGDAVMGGVFRLTDYIRRQTEAGKKINPIEAAKETLCGMGRGALNGLAAGSNPLSALSQMAGIVGNIITRVMYEKAANREIDFENLANIAKEALYDRYGGRPVTTPSVAAARPVTTPSAAPGTSVRDPRAGCGGNGNGYGYNYGSPGFLKSTPSLSDKLKERWSDPTVLINDVSTAISIGGLAGSTIYKASNAIKTMKDTNTLAKAAGKSQAPLKMNLQSFGGKSGSKTYKYNMVENPGPLADMPNNPASNFASGKYNMDTLNADTIFYRAGESGKPYGQWFISKPANSAIQVRMDTAVKPQWINSGTGVLEGHSYVNTNYAIKIPRGTTVYTGPVGYQGGAYLGGQNIMQTYIPKPWDIPGVKVINSSSLR